MNPKIFFFMFNIVLVICACILFFKINNDYGKVLKGENWESKQYGTRYVLSIKNGSEVVKTLSDFVRVRNIKVAQISGLGAVSSATLRFYNPNTKKYADKTFDEQMELANLLGNVSTKDGESYIHIHATFGNDEYKAVAGHLLSAKINGAAEFVVDEIPKSLIERKYDDETGLNIYDFGAKNND